MHASQSQERAGPLVLLRRLRSDEDAPRAARALIDEMLVQTHSQVARRRDDVILCVSELVANAVVHGEPGHLTLQFAVTDDAVRIEVGDDGVEAFSWPDRLSVEGHWGLNLVKDMSDRSGIDRRPWTVGWCEFDLEAGPSG